MLGRGLRIMPGKADCMVLDFTDRYHQVSWEIGVSVVGYGMLDVFDHSLQNMLPAATARQCLGGNVLQLKQQNGSVLTPHLHYIPTLMLLPCDAGWQGH